MIIRIATAILLLFSTLAAYTQGLDCKEFRNGRFKFIDTKNGINMRVERLDNTQIETDINTNSRTVYRINWINDCEYEMTIVEGNSDYLRFYKSRTLIIKIIEKFSDGYRFEGHIKGTREYKTHFMRYL